MGTVTASVEQILSAVNEAKLHGGMCRKLARLVYKIIKIFPSLEAVKPRCVRGIQSLCALHVALDKAKSLLQHCSECSKLYLAITGDSILLKFVKIKDALDQTLSSLETMVPQSLAQQIAEIVKELEQTTFALEPSEEEVGNDVITLLQKDKDPNDLNSASELKAFHGVADRLGIISPGAVLTEKRALKKLLDEAHCKEDQRKESIIVYLLHLLGKYAKSFRNEYPDDVDLKILGPCCRSVGKSASEVKVNGRKNDRCGPRHHSFDLAGKEISTNVGAIPVPPEEFRCPISLQLMSEPVVISSGQTYERMCIEKWFNKGHDTCPKTQQKLSNLSLTPNYCVKGLIASWCEKHGIKVPEPLSQPPLGTCWRQDSSDSEFVTSVDDACLTMVKVITLEDEHAACSVENEVFNVSTRSFGGIYYSDSPFIQKNEGSSENCDTNFVWTHMVEPEKTQADNCKRYKELLANLMTPPLELQCRAAEEIKLLSIDDEARCYMVVNGFVPALVSFLQSAVDASDITAQKVGVLALLSIAECNRNHASILSAGALVILVNLLQSEAAEAAIAVLLMLSRWDDNKVSIATSGAVHLLIKFLDSESYQCRHDTISILYNLSTVIAIWAHTTLGSVSKLVHFVGTGELVEKCVTILYNLASIEEGRKTIAETEGCIMALAELLDTGTVKEQGIAAATLFLLCTHSHEHSQLVLQEGVIPSLLSLSVNGSSSGRDKAQKLLDHFREQRQRDSSWQSSPEVGCSQQTMCNGEKFSKKKRTKWRRAFKKTCRKMISCWRINSPDIYQP